MSSKANRFSKKLAEQNVEPVKTKEITYSIKLDIDSTAMYVISIISGVPVDLPAEYESTVLNAVKSQFAEVINSKSFIEAYAVEEPGKDDTPSFINLRKLDYIKVISIKKVSERELNK